MLLLVAAGRTAQAEVQTVASDGFVIAYAAHLDATAGRIYAALPALGRWWDSSHTWSGDAANLSLSADAGGCFCERWKDGAVEHGRVIMVKRDQLLRLQTALGPLQGRAVSGVLTFEIKPDQSAGNGTKTMLLTLTYVVNGASASALDKIAPAVNEVLGEQFGRLVRFIETGKPEAS